MVKRLFWGLLLAGWLGWLGSPERRGPGQVMVRRLFWGLLSDNQTVYQAATRHQALLLGTSRAARTAGLVNDLRSLGHPLKGGRRRIYIYIYICIIMVSVYFVGQIVT